jgi:hypothetical protein
VRNRGDVNELAVLAGRPSRAALDQVADDGQRGALQLLLDDVSLFAWKVATVAEDQEYKRVRFMVEAKLRRVTTHVPASTHLPCRSLP